MEWPSRGGCYMWDRKCSTFLQYPDQRCLALYLCETFLLWKRLLSRAQQSIRDRHITSYFRATFTNKTRKRAWKEHSLPTWCTRRCLLNTQVLLRICQISSFFPSSNKALGLTPMDEQDLSPLQRAPMGSSLERPKTTLSWLSLCISLPFKGLILIIQIYLCLCYFLYAFLRWAH